VEIYHGAPCNKASEDARCRLTNRRLLASSTGPRARARRPRAPQPAFREASDRYRPPTTSGNRGDASRQPSGGLVPAWSGIPATASPNADDVGAASRGHEREGGRTPRSRRRARPASCSPDLLEHHLPWIRRVGGSSTDTLNRPAWPLGRNPAGRASRGRCSSSSGPPVMHARCRHGPRAGRRHLASRARVAPAPTDGSHPGRHAPRRR